jgi:hypothetical protein
MKYIYNIMVSLEEIYALKENCNTCVPYLNVILKKKASLNIVNQNDPVTSIRLILSKITNGDNSEFIAKLKRCKTELVKNSLFQSCIVHENMANTYLTIMKDLSIDINELLIKKIDLLDTSHIKSYINTLIKAIKLNLLEIDNVKIIIDKFFEKQHLTFLLEFLKEICTKLDKDYVQKILSQLKNIIKRKKEIFLIEDITKLINI